MPDGATFPREIRTEKPVSVRVAGPADEAALRDLFLAAHADNGLMTVSREKVARWAHIFTHHPHGTPLSAVGVIDGPNGTLAAGAALVLGQPWYSDEWVIEDRMIFVRPEHRKSRHGRDLLLFSKWYAEKLALPMILGIVTTNRSPEKTAFYRRYLTQVGALFHHEGRPNHV